MHSWAAAAALECVKLRPTCQLRAHACLAAPADAEKSRKQVQLSDLQRKKICHLAVEHKSLLHDKLTALLQQQLKHLIQSAVP